MPIISMTFDQSWQRFLEVAKDYLNMNRIYYSPKKGNEYVISNVTDDLITIKRLSVKNKTEVDLSKKTFLTSFNRILDAKQSLPKAGIHKKVAFEATIVFFLPMLDWDEEIKNILIDKTYKIEADKNLVITQAKNDDINEFILRKMRVRRGQNKLRDNLFSLYDGKCCISECNVEEALHACHIVPHSETGDNNSSNAILLRADIHDLFDSHLIGINPDTLRVHIKNGISKTEYAKFEGKKIPIDAIVDTSALKKRWEIFNDNVK